VSDLQKELWLTIAPLKMGAGVSPVPFYHHSRKEALDFAKSWGVPCTVACYRLESEFQFAPEKSETAPTVIWIDEQLSIPKGLVFTTGLEEVVYGSNHQGGDDAQRK
jgi:hypothetical protein